MSVPQRRTSWPENKMHLSFRLQSSIFLLWGGVRTGRGRNRFIWKALECSDNKSFYLLFHLSSGNESLDHWRRDEKTPALS